MEKLIIVRHGDHVNNFLTEAAQLRMQNLGIRFAQMLQGKRVHVMTSTSMRAQRSAKILAGTLQAEMQAEEIFYSMDDTPVRLRAALELIRSKSEGTQALIIVTHLEYTRDLPAYIGEHALQQTRFPERSLSRGEAYVIDCIAKTIEHIT